MSALSHPQTLYSSPPTSTLISPLAPRSVNASPLRKRDSQFLRKSKTPTKSPQEDSHTLPTPPDTPDIPGLQQADDMARMTLFGAAKPAPHMNLNKLVKSSAQRTADMHARLEARRRVARQDRIWRKRTEQILQSDFFAEQQAWEIKRSLEAESATIPFDIAMTGFSASNAAVAAFATTDPNSVKNTTKVDNDPFDDDELDEIQDVINAACAYWEKGAKVPQDDELSSALSALSITEQEAEAEDMINAEEENLADLVSMWDISDDDEMQVDACSVTTTESDHQTFPNKFTNPIQETVARPDPEGLFNYETSLGVCCLTPNGEWLLYASASQPAMPLTTDKFSAHFIGMFNCMMYANGVYATAKCATPGSVEIALPLFDGQTVFVTEFATGDNAGYPANEHNKMFYDILNGGNLTEAEKEYADWWVNFTKEKSVFIDDDVEMLEMAEF